MLHFSKLKIIIIYTIIIILSFFSITNFINVKDNLIFSRNVNLGLDLQGGSYLLLEVDSEPIINRNLQQKLLLIRKSLKLNNIKYQNLKIENQSIKFVIGENSLKNFEEFFQNKENSINKYYDQFFSVSNFYFQQEIYFYIFLSLLNNPIY